MFSNVALDVFIGLIFIYLLYSLLATILQELIARALNLRARLLQKSIRKMLEDNSSRPNPDADIPFWKRLTILTIFYDFVMGLVRFFNPKWENEYFLRRFYNHPSIKYLGQDYTSSKPSYLHAQNFSLTIIQLLRGDTYDGRNESESELIRSNLENNSLQISPETLHHIRSLFYDARQDSLIFRIKLENWFDEMQERTTGWYRKQTQVILIFTGLFIAWLFNVDTIAIYGILAQDKDVRESMVQMAIDNREKYRQVVLSVDSATKLMAGKDTVVVRKIPDTTLEKTYNMLAHDAERANEILGLGKPWKDSCNVCNDSIAAIQAINNQENYENILSQLLETREAESLRLDNEIKDLQNKRVGMSKTQLARRVDSITTVKNRAVLLTDSLKDKLMNFRQRLLFAKRCKYIEAEMAKNWPKYSPNQVGGATTIVGWMLTALAISLGAPFWFDLLNKFIQIRGTGPKPPPSPTSDAKVGTNSLRTTDGKIIRG